MKNNEIIEIFKSTGAMLSGHFQLTSGRHSDTYMQCAKLFSDSKNSEKICKMLAEKLKDKEIDIIISPAVGGIIMGYELSRHLGVNNIFAERENGKMKLRRGFSLSRGEKVLVVEDVVTTGGSVKEVILLCESLGADVVAVSSIVDRSGAKVNFGVDFVSLLEMDIESYEKINCPLCKENKAIDKPGSREI